MIVEPGFLDHWKTQALIRATNDPASPLMVLRLWEHCQFRKTDRFLNLPESALTSICRWTKNPAELLPILIECGWITRDGDYIIIHDWSETNRILVSAWKNGTKGGRPRKLKVLKKPTGKPTDNRTGTGPSPLSTLSYLSVLKSESVRERFKKWIEIRKSQGKKPKDWDSMFSEQCEFLKQFDEAGQIEAISASIRGNWQGLFAPNKNGQQQKPKTGKDPDELMSDKLWQLKHGNS